MLKRIFIAINPESKIKEKLFQIQENWPELPCKWVAKENLHLTLAFLGNTGQEKLEKTEQLVKKLSKSIEKFSISLDQVCYGPGKKVPPMLIWIKGDKNKQISKLSKELNQLLFKPETKDSVPHITLGRIKANQWTNLDLDERPDVNLHFPIEFSVNSIEIMETKLKRSGAEYTVLKSFNL